MSDPNGGMSKPEIILAYIKTLIWPVFVLIFLALFYQPISAILASDIEMEMFGVRFSGSQQSVMTNLKERSAELEELVTQMTNELETASELNSELIEQNDSLNALFSQESNPNVPEAAEKLEALEEHNEDLLRKNQRMVRASEQIVQKTRAAFNLEEFDQAEAFEKEAFDLLLRGDYEGSIAAFEAAEKSNPGYHNAYEISKLLNQNLEDLNREKGQKNSKKLQEVFRVILKKHSWGVKDEIIQKMEGKLAH